MSEKTEHPLLPAIKQMRAAGKSFSVIAGELGLTKNQVIGIWARAGLQDPLNNPIKERRADAPRRRPPPWSIAEEAQLLAFLRDEEASADALVDGLGRTRREILDHVGRLRLRGVPIPPRAAARFTASAQTSAPKARPAPLPAGMTNNLEVVSPGCASGATGPAAPPAPAAERVPSPSPPRATFSGRCCQWPMGDPRAPGFRFCEAALPAGTQGPYCAKHHALAYVRAPAWSDEQREAARARYIAREQERRRAAVGVVA